MGAILSGPFGKNYRGRAEPREEKRMEKKITIADLLQKKKAGEKTTGTT